MYISYINFNPPKWLLGVTALHVTAEIQHLAGVNVRVYDTFSRNCDFSFQANLDESQMSSSPFLRALMTAVCKAAVKGEQATYSCAFY